MKQLLFLLFLVSFNAFSQEIDWIGADYGIIDDAPKCSREACILDDDYEFGFYEMEDREGQTYLKLNTESSLLDLPFEGMCFTGDKEEVLKIVEGLAGNANAYYPQGGHFDVVGLYAKKFTDDAITVEVTILSDYDRDLIREDLILARCK